jgi:mannonate dehydratase
MARQAGATAAVVGLLPDYLKDPEIVSFRGISGIIKNLADYDLALSVVEGDPIPLEQVRLGLPGRNTEIAQYQEVIKVLGDVGVRIMCPNFMAGINWVRTSTDVPIRGGALTTGFCRKDMPERHIDLGGAVLTEAQLWDNLRYFMDHVLPVAEDAGVRLGLHPDDPPLSPVYNVPRIVTSANAYRQLFREYPSESIGMTFCQGNFRLMDEDIYAMAEEFGALGKVFFVHFRDVTGHRADFEETFHDDGPTDMARMMRIYMRHCPDAPIRPDHVPTVEGDDNTNYGYTMRGRLFAMGYIKGLLDGIGLQTDSAASGSPPVHARS